LARYAALCQDEGIVPIIEPEVLMDGSHPLETCFEVTRRTLATVFAECFDQRIDLPGALLKPNMVIPGKKCSSGRATPDQIAEATIACFLEVVPAAIPGIVFLSGGQSDEEATANLDAINKRGPHPWEFSFSYGRALQSPALQAWRGADANLAAGQAAYAKRAKLNGLARDGKYEASMEIAA
ncbi:MAG TPA: class I fructose-bisphosphate aldolase, partial [Acidimicrobiia bacterium]